MVDRLAEVRAKFDWACKHNKRWWAAVDTWAENNRFGVSGQLELDGWFVMHLSIKNPVPDEVGLIYADAVHNLRAVLDHVACHLIDLHGRGACDESTYFPVVKKRKDWRDQVRQKLRGFPTLWLGEVEAAQPFTYGARFREHPLHLLHQLDIRMKHRNLVPVRISGVDFNPMFRLNRDDLQDKVVFESEQDLSLPLEDGVEIGRARPISPPGIPLWIKEMTPVGGVGIHFGPGAPGITDYTLPGVGGMMPNLCTFVGSVIDSLAPAFS